MLYLSIATHFNYWYYSYLIQYEKTFQYETTYYVEKVKELAFSSMCKISYLFVERTQKKHDTLLYPATGGIWRHMENKILKVFTLNNNMSILI